MLKLYRFANGKKEYWETWEYDNGSHTIHWGELGTRGESRNVRSTLFAKAEKIIQKEIDRLLQLEFRPIDLDDHHICLSNTPSMEWARSTMSRNGIGLRRD